MSNTIKLKRGTGSDPSASDLVVGEVALRTDSGKLFTKKDDGSVAQIGGGAGAIDDGAITNAKVASDAAIAGSKIDPSFTGDLTITSSLPKISLTDSGDNPDYEITNTNGSLNFKDTTNNATRISIQSSATTIANNLDCGAGIDVTGNITATGSVTSTGLIMGDNKSILLGASDDFRIRHTGSHSEITDEGTGNLRLGSNQVIIGSPTFDETSAKFVDDGAVELYFNNSKKFETTNQGATLTGRLTADGLDLGDSETLRLGDSQDLQLFHNGNHSYISDLGTGDLRITGSAIHLQNAAQSENMIKCFEGDKVELYYNNSKKFETTSGGSKVTGNFIGTGDILVDSDSHKLKLGLGEDLELYHDGTDNYIESTGKLYIKSSNFVDIRSSGNETMIKATPNGAVDLYYDNVKKFETTSSGATVTGTLTATSFSGSGASLTSLNASNISSGTIPAARVGDITGNAASADTIDVTGKNDSVTYYPTFVNNSGSAKDLHIDNGGSLNYNPSTNVLTAGTFSGALSGNASSATQLANARTIAGTSFNGTANIDISYNNLTNKPTIPTNNNQLSNGAGYITSVSGQNYNSLSNKPTIPTNNNQLSNGAGYITSVSGQNYNSLSNKPTIPSNNNQLSNGAGYITSSSDRACRAWVNFRGNSTVVRNDNANVSSVSDNGVGHYTVSFASSMPNSDYCVTVGFMDDAGNSNVAKIVDNSLGTGSFQIKTGSFQDGSGNNNRDFDGVFCAVFAG